MIELINEQAAKGPRGAIAIKVNGLTDPAIIDALYAANNEGVPIRLVVRTLCCLRPGVPGLSQNISVHSLVGEFLEHSRIFFFGDQHDPDVKVFFGSADLMERNLDRRVEVVVPIDDAKIQDSLWEAFELTWQDDAFSWALGTDRRWRRLTSVNHSSAQRKLKDLALSRSRSATQ